VATRERGEEEEAMRDFFCEWTEPLILALFPAIGLQLETDWYGKQSVVKGFKRFTPPISLFYGIL
jgi:hypothetical protein